MSKSVKIVVESVGQAFGCKGVVVSARTGKELARCEEVRPYGNKAAAHEDAETLAAAHGWMVQS